MRVRLASYMEPGLLDRVSRFLLWAASFFFGTALFLVARKLLRVVPPTDPVAIGRVTIEGASKLRDYLSAGLFYLLVPLAAVIFFPLALRWIERTLHRLPPSKQTDANRLAITALFSGPFFIAPFFYLTTGKEGWGVLLPLLLAFTTPSILVAFQTRRWLRELFSEQLGASHALLFCEGASWILFRYLVTGKRIAHLPTLFLEIVFVALFMTLFWGITLLASHWIALMRDGDAAANLESFVLGFAPLLLLPFLGLTLIRLQSIVIVVFSLTVVTTAWALGSRVTMSRLTLRRILALGIIPALLFSVTYASTASLSQWIDLFHRGETLGPASDYLRGKVPYRDVFVLHGLLEDGLLDAWLMDSFGRSADVAMTRSVVLGALTMPALFILGFVMFDSIAIALAVVGIGFVTSVDNQRALLEILCLTLIIASWRTGRRWLLLAAGCFASLALFFSFETGLYSIAAGAGSILLVAVLARRAGDERTYSKAGAELLLFIGGMAIMAAPFLLYLQSRSALNEFFSISFILVPSVIDATWSLPFPDLAAPFRALSLRVIADFLLSEKIRFVLNPLVIAIALTWIVWRAFRRDRIDPALIAVTLFALITQRSALGRADFQHQAFAAFLIAPLLIGLLVLVWPPMTRIWRSGDRGAQLFLVMVMLVSMPFLATALWIPDLVNARLTDTIWYRPRVSRIGYRDPAGEKLAGKIAAVRGEIQKVVPKGQTIFDFSNQPALYFFADRPNATRFYQTPVLSPIDLELEAIQSLEQKKPKLVLRGSPEKYDVFDGVRNETRAPALAAYIDEHYEFFRNVRGIELWRRVGGMPQVSVERYRSFYRMPSNNVLKGTSRIVFASVAAIHGMGGADWRSDLLLLNPFPEPLRLRLRYSFNGKRREREIVVEPGKNVRVENLVATLFQAPETFGHLTLEHRSGSPPVARVKNYDASGASGSSMLEPLDTSLYADATEKKSELKVLGFLPGEGRRVNLGLINTGESPAVFKIHATRAGNIEGEPVEGTIAEEGSYLLVDVVSKLGTYPLDESVVLHTQMIEGRAVGYASLIDTASGTHQTVSAVPTVRQ